MSMGSTNSESNEGQLGRKLIICFDGTGQNEKNKTNIALLFKALDDASTGSTTQFVHYEQGIGSAKLTDPDDLYGRPWKDYTPFLEEEVLPERGSFSGIKELFKNGHIATYLDQWLALSLEEHLVSAYKFLVNTYQNEDRIYIFGYSRGAYSARALAGMIYKVGLVPNANREQIKHAYKLYKQADEDGWRKSGVFKARHSLSPKVEFLGLWDTVSSVGPKSKHLPFTKVASLINIKCIRHAICLDERRLGFSPDLVSILPEQWQNAPEFKYSTEWEGIWKRVQGCTDVCEMWFAGCHSDVGGGNSEPNYSLSRIPLRWMIRQCYENKTGLKFPSKWLTDFGFELDENDAPMPEEPYTFLEGDGEGALEELWRSRSRSRGAHTNQNKSGIPTVLLDAISPIHDEIKTNPIWGRGLVVRVRAPYLPIQLHPTVQLREDALSWATAAHRNRKVQKYVKDLKLRTYASRLAKNSRLAEIEEEDHKDLMKQLQQLQRLQAQNHM